MPLTTAAAQLIAAAMVGAAYTDYDAASSYVGVGDGTAAFDVAQTDLQGTNKLRKLVDAAPGRAGAVLTFVATYGLTEANFAAGIQEVATFNAAAAGTMLHRKVQALGVKPNTEIWRITVTLTLAGG